MVEVSALNSLRMRVLIGYLILYFWHSRVSKELKQYDYLANAGELMSNPYHESSKCSEFLYMMCIYDANCYTCYMILTLNTGYT